MIKTCKFIPALLAFILLSLPALSADEQSVRSILDTRVSFDVQDAEVGGVLKVLADSFDLNIVASEGIKGSVTLSLKDVRLQDALDLLLAKTGFYYRVKDNVILIENAENQLVTEVIHLNYVKASEVVGSVKTMLSEKASVSTVDRDDQIVIKELPNKLADIRKEIEKLDKLPPQILIEARMVEVEDTDLTAFGISWSSNFNLAGMFNDKAPLTSRGIVAPGITDSGTALDLADTEGSTSVDSGDFRLTLPETSADLTGGQLAYGFTIRRANVSSILDALVRKNKAHLLASPSIATLDGQEAKIIIGEKFPFRENTLTAVGTTETTKFIDVGVALRVTPKMVGEETISLSIHPEVSSVTATLDDGPRIGTREATTKVIVKSGQTIVIAGLIRNDKTVIRQKVPFFGDIPVVGLAFRNKSVDFVARELAVFITPYLMGIAQGEEGEFTGDRLTPELFYNRGIRLMDEYGIESLGKSEAQRYSEAIANFRTIIKNQPQSEQADDALYQMGRLYDEKLKNDAKAAQVWNQLKKQYPDSPYITREFLAKLKAVEKKAERQARKKQKT